MLAAPMFFLKKLISSLLLPLPVCLGIVAAGLILLWFTRRQRAARILCTVGFGLLVITSYGGIANLFVRPLENDFRPLLVDKAPAAADAQARGARWIVVLGGGHADDKHLPPSSELSPSTLARLIEGLRLKRKLPNAKVLLSGGFGWGGRTHAELLADAAVALGFSREDLVLEKRTFDTADEAQFISATVGRDPFILVSSATHLPRAAALFRKQGSHPLPSPTDFTAFDRGLTFESFLPSATAIHKLERANHEYIGHLWSTLRGQL